MEDIIWSIAYVHEFSWLDVVMAIITAEFWIWCWRNDPVGKIINRMRGKNG